MGLPGQTDDSVYRGLKDILQRHPAVTTVSYEPDSIVKQRLRAIIAPNRIEAPTGPESPRLDVAWRFVDDQSYYRIHYADPNTGLSCGWHRDEDHPELGAVHFQYDHPGVDGPVYESASFTANSPPRILWEALDRLFEAVVPAVAGELYDEC